MTKTKIRNTYLLCSQEGSAASIALGQDLDVHLHFRLRAETKNKKLTNNPAAIQLDCSTVNELSLLQLPLIALRRSLHDRWATEEAKGAKAKAAAEAKEAAAKVELAKAKAKEVKAKAKPKPKPKPMPKPKPKPKPKPRSFSKKCPNQSVSGVCQSVSVYIH